MKRKRKGQQTNQGVAWAIPVVLVLTIILTPAISFGDAPPVIVTNEGLNLQQGETVTITKNKLETTDPDTPAYLLIYTVTQAPAHGNLPNDTFSQAAIDAGLITYHHDNSDTEMDSFVFTVSDGTNTLPPTNFEIRIMLSQIFASGFEGRP